ncbi:MAG: hypothetical protein CMJ40_06425 [Phycisphaerae bacterium]|nr:hypothetical protein [Phycisphaerae bacterium]
MNYQIHTLFLIAFSGCLLTDIALAKHVKKHDPSQQSWQPQKPIKFYPLAHTNQDGENDEKRMFGGMPNDMSLSSGLKLLSPVGDDGIFDLIIKIANPADSELPISTGDAILSMIVLDQAGKISSTDLLSKDEVSKYPINNLAKSGTPEVPAPGALGLLALGGLSTARRRRKR